MDEVFSSDGILWIVRVAWYRGDIARKGTGFNFFRGNFFFRVCVLNNTLLLYALKQRVRRSIVGKLLVSIFLAIIIYSSTPILNAHTRILPRQPWNWSDRTKRVIIALDNHYDLTYADKRKGIVMLHRCRHLFSRFFPFFIKQSRYEYGEFSYENGMESVSTRKFLLINTRSQIHLIERRYTIIISRGECWQFALASAR